MLGILQTTCSSVTQQQVAACSQAEHSHSRTMSDRVLLVFFAQLRAQILTHYSKRLKTLNLFKTSFRKFSYEEIHNLASLSSLKSKSTLCPICLISGYISCVKLSIIYPASTLLCISDTISENLKTLVKKSNTKVYCIYKSFFT